MLTFRYEIKISYHNGAGQVSMIWFRKFPNNQAASDWAQQKKKELIEANPHWCQVEALAIYCGTS